ncbi:SMC-Scp complex subunit ScpB [Foetidibacter luteolus]|uniref:SMC-Scp complex subunit ScpB n=1 Tax=Foetidibacter luteolus TaxID=2608880 RepID=UPI00129BFCF3|nr:SMC-Scp complex subunit ScpB [Foetidibacter luteolus]
MELSQIIPHIEALIFASEKPLTALDVVELVNNAFGFMEERITLDQVESCLDGIREKYSAEFYAFEVKESGGGWQFLTKKDFHKTIAQLNGDKFLKRLSTAALETLSIIAYKQPITKGEIESIRGVNSDYSIQKLLEKELIVITGRSETLPGKPLVYSTSKTFMDYFGINSTDDLPKIKEVLADQLIEPTVMREGSNLNEEEVEKTADETLLHVDSSGVLVDAENTTGDENTAGEPAFSEEELSIESSIEEDEEISGEIAAEQQGEVVEDDAQSTVEGEDETTKRKEEETPADGHADTGETGDEKKEE